MNGVIHQCSHSSDEKLITSRDESEIFLAIFAYVQALFDKIRPSKLFFLAVDGVAPRAKMNQQRSRRFRTASEKAEAEAKEAKKEQAAMAKVLNDPNGAASNSKTPVKYFDTNCITPGTEFMEKLSAHLCYLIAKRIDEDPNWRNVKIVFSGPEVPGEGEHKVMEWIRSERTNPNHEANLRHCLYGLDADLIMLGLLSHEPHFSLLREEVTFGRSKKTVGSSGLKSADQTRFQLLHLGLMRDYMQNEFGGVVAASLPFTYDFERILDDFVLLSLFVGNDFLPHLPHLHINENALGLLFEAYKMTLPQLDGYLNDCGKINLKRCAKVLENVVKFERQVFESECADELMSISTRAKSSQKALDSSLPPITPKQRAIFDEFVSQFLMKEKSTFWECDPELIANHPEDRVFVAGLAKDFILILEFTEDHSFVLRKCFEDEEEEFLDPECTEARWEFTINTTKVISKYEKRPILSELDPAQLAQSILQHEESLWQSWKARYYSEKMEIRETKSRDALIQKYCEGLEWVMAYYYEGVASWSWFFNYHYAPFLSDIIDFLNAAPLSKDHVGNYKMSNFELGRPFAPFEQLMGVLPSLSSALVPAPLATLMISPESPILHFFPTEFESDLNGKKNSWEAVVKIPFIDEDLLVKTLNQKYCLLTEVELRRNRFGDSYTFEYCKGASFNWSAPSASFDPLEDSHVKMIRQEIGKPSREELRKGLALGTLFGLEGPPSFPSLRTLPHSSALQHLDIQVFPGQASKSMTLALVITDEHVAKYNGKPFGVFENESVFINWPHLLEAKIVAVTDGERVYTREKPFYPMDLTPQLLQKYAGQGIQDYGQLTERIEETYLRKQGILLAGGVNMLAVLHPFKNLRMDSESGAILKEFDEARCEIVPLQLLVFNLPRVDERFQGRDAFSNDPVASVAKSFHLGDEVIYVGPMGIAFGSVDGFVQDGRALTIKVEDIDSPDLSEIVKSSTSRIKSNFLAGKEIADKLGVPMWLLSKLTSTLQIIHQGKSVVNVGFGIKFEGKARAVPDLARRYSPGKWEYSRIFVAHLEEYVRKFPNLISALVKSGSSSDRPNLETMVPNATMDEIKSWLKSHGYPVGSESCQPCDRVEMLDSRGVEELSGLIERSKLKNALNRGKDLRKLSPCKPEHLLTRDTARLYTVQQTAKQRQLSAGDRAIWCGDGADGVPFGCPGSITAVFSDSTSTTIWFLADLNLRGIGCDLGGFLPGSLKNRGLVARPEKILKLPQAKQRQGKFGDIRVNSNIMKFADATEKSKPKAIESKIPHKPVNSHVVPSVTAVEILDNLFQAASLASNGPKEAAKMPAKSNVKSNSSTQQPGGFKKKPATTSGTVKISYSTRTKASQIK